MNFSNAAPESIASISNALASSSVSALFASTTIWEPNVSTSSVKSFGPCPFNVSIASCNSSALPIARPSGWFISEIIAIVLRPTLLPIRTIACANASASSNVFINAPLPVFTSNTIASAPAAIFLLIIEEAINGIELTVPVTSLKAYNFLSAGVKFPDCPTTATLFSLTNFTNVASSISTWKPSIASNLSIVPPVWPNPRPLIFATGTSTAATNGAKTNVVVSPTPPVECLSTLTPLISLKSIISPELTIAIVNAARSSSFISWK